ncbi:hypothetical protein VPH234P10_0071 [Vibrio phage 234P10]|nr:hypothetical protein SIPHO062v1_p0063 [Vibrio phage PS17B.1]
MRSSGRPCENKCGRDAALYQRKCPKCIEGGRLGTITGLKHLVGLPETASDTELFLAVETLVLNNETQPTTK